MPAAGSNSRGTCINSEETCSASQMMALARHIVAYRCFQVSLWGERTSTTEWRFSRQADSSARGSSSTERTAWCAMPCARHMPAVELVSLLDFCSCLSLMNGSLQCR
jgi:hypothetical protein